MSLTSRLALVSMAAIFGVPGFAGNVSFTGNFVNDNDVQLFTFDLLAASTVTLQTLGYGGGTNVSGQVIPSGGFESVLQIFQQGSGIAVGGPIMPGPDPTCGPRTPDLNRGSFCQDTFAQIFLSSGSYTLSLTQNANLPNGNLSDGFFYVNTIPDPSFNGGFFGSFGLPGDSHWAVDILFVDRASEDTQIPEPASAPLVGATAFLIAIGVRRLRLRSESR